MRVPPMSEMAARYDLRARSYGRCWAPVLAPPALGLLDAIGPAVAVADAPATRLLDAGTGSGTLAIEAVRRWPRVHVTGLDLSGGMLALARAPLSNAQWSFGTQSGPAWVVPTDSPRN